MLLSSSEEKALLKRLLTSRLRILCNQGFYGSLLMHMNFCLSDKVKCIGVNCKKIYFNPDFLKSISDNELDFVLLHEITHIAMKHNFRKKDYDDKELYDYVTDVIVNSNILKSFDMNEDSILLNGEVSEHKIMNREEGYKYSADELYALLKQKKISVQKRDSSKIGDDEEMENNNDGNTLINKSFDDHGLWEENMVDGMDEREWEKHVLDACETMFIRDPSNSRGELPGFAARIFKELKEAKTDWRTLLNNFIQEEINDYSFTPPDRRFDDSPFFLPDFNDTSESVKGVLFMIDTSGSMSDAQITTAYSEIKGAIEQFNGKLQGWLGFFDAAIIEPVEFSDEEELEIIRPFGGGGTSFDIIFSYIRDHMKDKNISSVVILTDGYAPWPKEEAANNIPTIWLINNEKSNPPWGKVARLPEDKASDNYN